ncbi:efflux RND transporter permease subunit [Bradyrhizobium diazoefficiens]|uniref:efflux RND transporter permease subunit n=1 Tax=Bradyrhizobium TaxID=374 RepID=UPI000413A37A|nr:MULTISPECIES: efflux RND transporter permease subunit [Bradyrhizobium]APO53631.1 acriflavine resistance protein B [Bradyrhizobium diazoefficiens]KOY11330.1 acriflavine resistance protein B [Bradyrhizobium diazoefficiens]MCD9295286.1 efflux RND transporter permease subunit [Bradyrhizobium diazoefficiens]MCD9809906.1 efflux RND transporter permease subunit [Bradyrhizobium diazoefficiens]MCD9827149.1 efflux RND transporter permease subunit [Bradyrhizobium diazoefficiens]
MSFTDIFIRRPVLAIVVSLMILVLGLKSMTSLPILQYPRTQNAIVTVTTTYYGADPAVVAGFITTPLENAIAQANGIDYMTSTSQPSTSTITVNLRLNFDSGKALTEINTKVNSVLNQLPSGVQQPVLTVKVGQTIDAMYLGFSSDVLAPNQITDYLIRVVQPKLQAVSGVQTAELLGNKTFALRAWLDPIKLAAYGLTASDVSTALSSNDYIAGLGTTKGQMVQVNLTAATNLKSLQEFRDLVVKQAGASNVKLSDVANVTLGSEDYDSSVGFNGKRAVYIGIQVAPNANLLDVIKGVRAVYPDIKAQQPEGLNSEIIYDSTDFVNSSIDEVIHTLLEALLIVTVVVFLFLGSWRSVLIPVIAIPLSLVGTFTMLLALGFSINLLTLLALVLAIGLVVDDAIIVVENVNRHLAEGTKPLQAAIMAARELAGPIVAMTIVLIAVYVPIGFQGGLTGALFTEFAFTLAGAVAVSAVIALTLTPMCCAFILKPANTGKPTLNDRIVGFIDARMETLQHRYRRLLAGSLTTIPVTVVFAALVLSSIYWLYSNSKNELAPEEDQGAILMQSTLAPNATLQQKLLYSAEVYRRISAYAETAGVFQLDLTGSSIAGWVLKPWDKRDKTAAELQPVLQQEMAGVAGAKIVAFQLPPLPGASGLPIQFVIQTTDPFDRLDGVAKAFTAEALKSGKFIFLDNDLKVDQPQTTVLIDREKTAQLGLKLSDVGGALGNMLGGGYVNYFGLDGRSYKVIPQVEQRQRLNADQVLNYYIKTSDGTSVPLSTVASLKTTTVPQSLNHFQQVNAATISGVAMPGVITGEALATLKEIADRTLPKGYTIDYGGQSRQFIQESSGFAATFGFALIIIFLALSAQFESFRDPLIILVSVPMSIAGALIFIMLGIKGASLNIYTEVGLVTLMGLISKHGILIVEFANELQHAGRSKRDAVIEATAIRLRPILMTTAAMVIGVMPLITATGAGAASRFNMGLVIASGLSIGTLFTLFVVPAFYILLAADHSAATGDDAVKLDAAGLGTNGEPRAAL